MLSIEIAGLIILGVGIGIFGTLIGAGGGFLAVPLLMILYNLDPDVAAGTSLLFVFINALSGSYAYIKQKRVDIKIGLMFTVMTIPGSIIGAYLTNYYVGSSLFTILFSILLILASLYLLIKPVREQKENQTLKGYLRRVADSKGRTYEYNIPLPTGLAISFGVGFVSSMFGVGGGIIHVPSMIFLLNFPVHIATATSQFILCFSSVVGAFTHAMLDNVRLEFALPMGVGAIIGAQIGARVSQRTKGTIIERLLSIGLIIVALRLLLKVFD